MAIQLAKKVQPFWYTPEKEKDEENPTRFKLMPLDGLQYVDIMAELHTDKDGNTSLTATGVRLAIKHGLVDAENLVDETGAVKAFNKSLAAKLDPVLLVDLANEIIAASKLGDDEAKN